MEDHNYHVHSLNTQLNKILQALTALQQSHQLLKTWSGLTTKKLIKTLLPYILNLTFYEVNVTQPQPSQLSLQWQTPTNNHLPSSPVQPPKLPSSPIQSPRTPPNLTSNQPSQMHGTVPSMMPSCSGTEFLITLVRSQAQHCRNRSSLYLASQSMPSHNPGPTHARIGS